MLQHCIESSNCPLCIFVDGLDGFQGRLKEQLDLAMFLQGLTSFDLVKVCVASRPHPVLQQKLSSGSILELQEWNKPGMQHFVFQTLTDMDLSQDPLQAEEIQHLAGLVADMAEGAFLWAKFALDNLIDLWSEQKLDFASLLLRLAQLPREVEDLWDQTRDKLTPDQKLEANALLQLVCFAAKPLTLIEFFEAWQYQDLIPLPVWVAHDYTSSRIPVLRDAIATLSCGLLEVGLDINGVERVLLVHKSVQRYLDTRGWWLAGKDATNPEQLWLRISTKALDISTWATDRTLCYQNKRHKTTNPVCKMHGCYNQLGDGTFPTKLIEDLRRLTLGRSKKTTFLKQGDAPSLLLAYVIHWLPYFAWRLEQARNQLCAALTNHIMCPETMYLCSYSKNAFCTSCSSILTQTNDGHSTPILFHGTEIQLPAISRKLHKETTLAHYLNDHITDLLISAEGSLDSALSQGTQNTNFVLTSFNHDGTPKEIVLMNFERDVPLQHTTLQQATFGSRGPPLQRKIAIVGSRSVGKASLTVQFVDGHYVESYYPTVENTFSKILRHKGRDYALELVDTAGQDEYSILNSKHFIGIHGYVIVYSVANAQSFEMVKVIREKILNHLGTDYVPTMIVGHKVGVFRPEMRQVTEDEGRRWAQEMRCGWIEAEARYNENVTKAFEGMVEEIEKGQEHEGHETPRCSLM